MPSPATGISSPESSRLRFQEHLEFLYGAERAKSILPHLIRNLDRWRGELDPPPNAGPLTERDAMLITYADQVRSGDEAPLVTLERFLSRHLGDLISSVHLLPFFPYSSDDGFSVIDYRQVDPALGTWDDILRIAGSYRLMIDAVINHVSAKSAWFRGFLDGDPEYADHFISMDPAADLSAVVRPRDLPLLTPVQTSLGQRHVWTTFSPDQVDLNYANPDVLLQMLDVLLSYVRHGAQFIRLDAIAFLWKEIGSSSIHLPQTHRVVKLMRDVLQLAAPWVFLITETNVPHDENVSYFGNGSDEAHMVYQFALPPLVLHTFHSGDATRLTEWATQLHPPSPQAAYFNFLASHDGIGLRPARGILSDEEIEALLAMAEERGGAVSYRALESGESDPYELNVSYLDALTPPDVWHASADRAVARFLASQAILLSLQGLPGIYFHSLFGSRNDAAGVSRSGRLRSINREKFTLEDLESSLTDATSLRGQVLAGFKRLLAARRANPAFHPAGFQEILDLDTAVFAILRTAPGSGERVLCLHEVAGVGASIAAPLGAMAASEAVDMITGQTVALSQLQMSPYQVLWIRLDEPAK